MSLRTGQSDKSTAKRQAPAPARVAAFKTAIGWIAVAWREEGLARLSFGYDSEPAALRALLVHDDLAANHETVAAAKIPWKLRERLKNYAAGKPADFADVPVDLSHLTDFQQKVMRRCRAIGHGKSLSYGELAEAAGKPRAARAVGTTMKLNRVPLIVPCHRVLAAGGKIGGYSCPQGISLKVHLLQLEGQR